VSTRIWKLIFVPLVAIFAGCSECETDDGGSGGNGACVTCPEDPGPPTHTLDKVVVYEKTGPMGKYTFTSGDHRLYEKLDELTRTVNDIRTGGCEWIDVYLSYADGRLRRMRPGDPLPENVYLTFVCRDVDCGDGLDKPAPSWQGAGHNLDAVELWLDDGTVYYATEVVSVNWGLCLQPVPENRDKGPENVLGAPDGVITGLGGGYSSVTVKLGP
jgi:hypothetical protein